MNSKLRALVSVGAALAAASFFFVSIWNKSPSLLQKNDQVRRRLLLANLATMSDPKSVKNRPNFYQYHQTSGNMKQPNFAVLVTVNDGFYPMWLNWLTFFERLAIPNLPVFLFAEDEQAHEKCLELLNSRQVDDSSYQADLTCLPWNFVFVQTEVTQTSKAFAYDDVGYRRMMSRRPAIVQHLLELGHNVIFSDVDVVWKRSPIPYIVNDFSADFYNSNLKIHILGQRDRLRLCPGFMIFRSCPEVIKLVDMWRERLNGKAQTNQVPFNEVLSIATGPGIEVENPDGTTEMKRVVAKFLPDNLFANGDLYFESFMTDEERDEVLVVHNNFIKGYDEKIERFRQFNLWAF